MSTFIANTLKYSVEEDKFYIRGGASNVVPRSNEWTSYQEKTHLLSDLIGGGIDLRCKNKLSLACLDAVDGVKQMHKEQFGERQKALGGCESINAYSLYMIKNYATWNKEDTIKNTRDSAHLYQDSYREERIRDAEIMEQIWDEAVEFYKKAESYFFNKTDIN